MSFVDADTGWVTGLMEVNEVDGEQQESFFILRTPAVSP